MIYTKKNMQSMMPEELKLIILKLQDPPDAPDPDVTILALPDEVCACDLTALEQRNHDLAKDLEQAIGKISALERKITEMTEELELKEVKYKALHRLTKENEKLTADIDELDVQVAELEYTLSEIRKLL